MFLQTNHYHVSSLGVMYTPLHYSILPIHHNSRYQGIIWNNHPHLDIQGSLYISIGPSNSIDQTNVSWSSLHHQFDPIGPYMGYCLFSDVHTDRTLDRRDISEVCVDVGNPSSDAFDTIHWQDIQRVVSASFLFEAAKDVGLPFATLSREFQFVFVINDIYLLLSVLLGSCQIVRFVCPTQENTQPGSVINELLQIKLYNMTISIIHKLC